MIAHKSSPMPDDCPVSDESRRALRNLARQAEWRGHAGAAGAALDARTLRELGREIENALALAPVGEPDRETWGHRASESLAACCQRAQPDWTPEQIAELNRLRNDALTALAPGPGEAEAEAEAEAAAQAASRRGRDQARDPNAPHPTSRLTLSSLTSRRPAIIALAIVACIVLIALVLALPHFLSNDSAQTPTASATTTIPATPTTAASAAQSASPTLTTSSTTLATSTPASTSPSAAAPTTSVASTSRVTGIQISPDVLDGDPPEVIVTANVNASGTGDVTIDFTITGSSGPTQVAETDESGQTSYDDLTQTINLSQWCGQSSVKLTVSSGAVSQSAPIAISGC